MRDALGTRLLREQLYGVAPGDLTTLAAVTTILLSVSLGAVRIPAWRAMRISPDVRVWAAIPEWRVELVHACVAGFRIRVPA